jgi:hypothetical protein
MLEANSGLQSIAAETGLSGRVSSDLQPIPLPVYQVPVTVAQNYATNSQNTVGMIDPTLHRPYVQQYSIGIQHEFVHTVLEARYVGNHVVGAYRSFDYNQVNINAGGFLQDFLRAQSNGLLALKQTGTFNPAFNASIAGSQRLAVFPTMPGGGQLTNATNRQLIQTGQVADLATTYQVNGQNGNINFFANPNALGTDVLTNYSQSTYNALQVEVRHRTHSGLSFEANYTFSKVLSDADGDSQSRIQHFLDINNAKLDRSRASFDLTHMIKADGFYQLPFGKGHRLHFRPLDRVIGGWTYGAIMSWQSGSPFSILSEYGTFNRSSGGRSYYNGADTSVSGSALFNVVKYQMTGNGPMFVVPSAINTADGTGAVNPGETPFKGEVFFNPPAGTIGTLQKRMFSGPWTFNIDMSVNKEIVIREGHTLEFQMLAINALNHATFFPGGPSTTQAGDYGAYEGNQMINSPTFGLLTQMFYLPRIVQFGLHYRF